MNRRQLPRIAMFTLVLSTLLAVQPAADAQSGRYGERADVVLVQIPVHVTRDGEPVRGLTAENFEVREGRKRQEVVAVDVYDLADLPSSPEAALASVPAPARRHFVLLFDLSNSQPAGILRAREAALELARSNLHPSDLVAVATYSQRRGIELLMGFSTDRTQLLAALDDLGLVDQFERLNDPLRLAVVQAEVGLHDALVEMERNPDNRNGRTRFSAASMLLGHLEDLSVLTSRATLDQIKQQITDLSTHLDELARLLDSVSGRKQVVLFSQGFDSEIVFGSQNIEQLRDMAHNVEIGKISHVNTDERFGASDVQVSLQVMLEQFNRSDAAIHTVDVGGLAAGGEAKVTRVAGHSFDGQALDRGHDGLFLMASETGGEFYRNFNDLGDAIHDLLERTSLTYVVSFRPRDVALDGSYHPIKIELQGVGKGVELSHRPGYYARRAFWELAPAERQLANAELLVAGQGGGEIGTELLALPFPGRGHGTADVLAAIEIDGAGLVAGQPDNLVPAEIYAYAFDEQGQIRDFLTQAITLDLHKVGYRLETGLKLLGHLELPPGKYQIRALVRNARTGASGLAVTDMRVPDFSGSEPRLLPPLFIENEDLWLVGQADREGDGEAPYPLMGADGPLVPASKPRLVNDQQIPLLLVGHGLPPALEAEGHLIGSDGRVHPGIAIDIDRRLGDPGTGERLSTRLLATDVAPGDYRLVVTVRGEGTETSSSLPVFFLGSG